MSQPQGSLYEIRWSEVCPWLILVRALRVSVMARVLALACAGVLVTQWGWSVVDFTLSESSARLERLTDYGGRPYLSDREFSNPNMMRHASRNRSIARQAASSPLVRGWSWLAQPFTKLINQETTKWRSLVLLVSGI